MAESNLRIYICGGHSTGKTTILKDLLDHVSIKPELDVARSVMQQMGKLKRWFVRLCKCGARFLSRISKQLMLTRR